MSYSRKKGVPELKLGFVYSSIPAGERQRVRPYSGYLVHMGIVLT